MLTSRDEASLSLGLMQAFDWLTAGFARYNDASEGTIRRPMTWLAYAFSYSSCLVAGFWVARLLERYSGTDWPPVADVSLPLIVFAPAFAGAVYVAGYALLALAVGHRNVAEWFTSRIEVDAAPPEVFCHLKVYSNLGTTRSHGLRHGIYESEFVIRDLAAIISAVENKRR